MGFRHVHSVNVGFVEEWCWCGYDGRKNDFVDGPDLALMTGLDVPSDVLVERGPPEMICKGASSRVESAVAGLVMCFSKDVCTF